ncbi:hypothetical protein BC628DRAFT_84841 [Trametes gibbosa]|nr:hypothetical protein BC628DRAFT_84841 [Trametes gibbosa]
MDCVYLRGHAGVTFRATSTFRNTLELNTGYSTFLTNWPIVGKDAHHRLCTHAGSQSLMMILRIKARLRCVSSHWQYPRIGGVVSTQGRLRRHFGRNQIFISPRSLCRLRLVVVDFTDGDFPGRPRKSKSESILGLGEASAGSDGRTRGVP